MRSLTFDNFENVLLWGRVSLTLEFSVFFRARGLAQSSGGGRSGAAEVVVATRGERGRAGRADSAVKAP